MSDAQDPTRTTGICPHCFGRVGIREYLYRCQKCDRSRCYSCRNGQGDCPEDRDKEARRLQMKPVV